MSDGALLYVNDVPDIICHTLWNSTFQFEWSWRWLCWSNWSLL